MGLRPAACTVEESPKQPSTSRSVPNVMLNLFILIFLCCLAFIDFSPCRLRPRTRVATACQGEISSGRSPVYCAVSGWLLREKWFRRIKGLKPSVGGIQRFGEFA